MKLISAWLQQPTSVAGISGVVGTLLAILLHQVTWAQAVPLLTGSLISILLPDNAAAKTSAEGLSQDILAKLRSRSGTK
jgi:hypothetical protein